MNPQVSFDDRRTIDERFAEFHRNNPHVYDELVAMARRAKGHGYNRSGIGMMWEVLRWNRMFSTNPADRDFKLNDHFRSRYARVIMDNERDLAGFFEVRSLRTE